MEVVSTRSDSSLSQISHSRRLASCDTPRKAIRTPSRLDACAPRKFEDLDDRPSWASSQSAWAPDYAILMYFLAALTNSTYIRVDTEPEGKEEHCVVVAQHLHHVYVGTSLDWFGTVRKPRVAVHPNYLLVIKYIQHMLLRNSRRAIHQDHRKRVLQNKDANE